MNTEKLPLYKAGNTVLYKNGKKFKIIGTPEYKECTFVVDLNIKLIGQRITPIIKNEFVYTAKDENGKETSLIEALIIKKVTKRK